VVSAPGRSLGGQQEPPMPFPAELVAAWEKAGAKFGWMARNPYVDVAFRAAVEGRQGDMPAFRFSEWKDGGGGSGHVLPSRFWGGRAGVGANRPRPPRAFGLHLRRTQVRDAGLKELAAL